MSARVAVVGMVCWLAGVVPAAAQTADALPRVAIELGVETVGGGSVGSVDAKYTTSSGGTFTLFSTSQSWSAGAGAIGRVLVRVAPRVQLEMGASWTRPEMRSSITGDAEAAPVTATQTVSQLVMSGGLVVSAAPHGGWRPFARASVGWMRHLSNDRTLFAEGVSADLGVGVVYAWRTGAGHLRPAGIRADVWLNARRGGMGIAPETRLFAPGLSATFIFTL